MIELLITAFIPLGKCLLKINEVAQFHISFGAVFKINTCRNMLD